MPESDDEFVGRLATRHSVSPAAVQAVLAAVRRGGGRMASSVTLILAACLNGRRACRWSGTCSTPNSNPSSTRFARISLLIWRRLKRVVVAQAPGRKRSATDLRRDRRAGGRPGWVARQLWVDRTTSDTRSSLRPVAWSSKIGAPYLPMTPGIIRFPGWSRLKVVTGRSRSQAKVDW